MATFLSPGVNVSEVDLTTIVPSVSTSIGAIAGLFRWGPVGERVLVDSETILIQKFGKPTNFNAETFFTAANFLSYTNALYVSRAANTSGANFYESFNVTGANNVYVCANGSANLLALPISSGMYITQTTNSSVAAANLTVATIVNSSAITLSTNSSGSGSATLYFGHLQTTYSSLGLEPGAFSANLVNQIITNENDYTVTEGNFDSGVTWVAKYPGAIGNSIKVSVVDNEASYSSNVSLSSAGDTFTIVANTSGVINGSNFINITDANTYLMVDDSVYYAVPAGNTAIGGLTGNTQYFVSFSNTTGIALSTTAGGSNVSITAPTTNPGESHTFSTASVGSIAINIGSSAATLTFTNDLNTARAMEVLDQVVEGDQILFGNNSISLQYMKVDSMSMPVANLSTGVSTATINFATPYRLHTNYSGSVINRQWEYFGAVGIAPGQSEWQLYNGNTAAMDEMHVVVVDEMGMFTGTPGTILETFKGVSRATDAKNLDNTTNYYKDVINNGSAYVWWAADRPSAPSATSVNLASSTSTEPGNYQFVLGTDGFDESNVSLATIASAYDIFLAKEDIDISIVLQGRPIGGTTAGTNVNVLNNYLLTNYIIDNLVEVRKDCVLCASPDKSLTLNAFGNEAIGLVDWRNLIHDSSYTILDSGYKYQYDRYNDVYRWIPMNGDIGGLLARTDHTNDAWWSPAGLNRGQIKNLVKLAWNPRQSDRDLLYVNGVNPVVTFPGQGTVLYGDKTIQSKPSAFDRINVRRLFIVLEKAISKSAKYSLFEFNDAFTRSQFKNLVTPYLRTIQGRRGITDFLVVCDDTNNTPQVIDANQFVGDIYIKPARSINFIQLNFVAVATGVQFSTVVGKF